MLPIYYNRFCEHFPFLNTYFFVPQLTYILKILKMNIYCILFFYYFIH